MNLLRSLLFFAAALVSLFSYAEVASDSISDSTGNNDSISEACVATDCGLTSASVFSPSADYKHTGEWRRYVGYTIAGSVCVGVGVPLLAVGIILTHVHNRTGILENGNFSPLVPLIGGAVISAASVPLFILAHKNRTKAKAMVGLANIGYPTLSGGYSATPGISFVINW